MFGMDYEIHSMEVVIINASWSEDDSRMNSFQAPEKRMTVRERQDLDESCLITKTTLRPIFFDLNTEVRIH